jgi:phospholipase C
VVEATEAAAAHRSLDKAGPWDTLPLRGSAAEGSRNMTQHLLRKAASFSCGVLTFGILGSAQAASQTASPIKHLVVIFQENVSFDHYFGTYPIAANVSGEPRFKPLPNTPGLPGQKSINTLASAGLLKKNPNKTNTANGSGAANPFRLDITQAATADQNHGYTAEQGAFDNFAMDLFPLKTGTASKGGSGTFYTKGQVMGYYDGNTVTALWNYAQHFAMSDNSFGTTFGPSTVGAINLISGQTSGVILPKNSKMDSSGTFDSATAVSDGHGGLTDISDDDPTGDVCSQGSTFRMSGRNIGDLLNAKSISWGFFEGGFDLKTKNGNGTTGCGRSTTSSVTNVTKADYTAHHEPFQYYTSTANPDHARPKSVALIGRSNDGANHQYDITDFFAALKNGNMPAVSFLKAPSYQDGHAGSSDPLDEQRFLVNTINTLEASPDWKNTAVIILWDDSDGWYDHAHAVVNSSSLSGYDVLNGHDCESKSRLNGLDGKPAEGRCGYGMRQPLLVISPYAKANYVNHTLTDQTSVDRFIEDNWLGGTRIGHGSFDAISGSLDKMFDFSGGTNPRLKLDAKTGEPVKS